MDQFLQSITVDTSLAFPHDEPLQDESLTSQEQIVFDLPLKRTLVFDQDNTAQFMITAEDDGSMQGEIRCQFDGSDLSKEYARFIALSSIMRYAYGVENLTNTVVSASGEFGEICYRDGAAAPEEWTQTDGYAAIDLSDDELDQAIDEVCVLLDIHLL